MRADLSTLTRSVVGSPIASAIVRMLVLLSTQDDCRDYVVSDVERLFDAEIRKHFVDV